MNNFEFASYLSMKGYPVYMKRGLDLESLLFEEYELRPINYDKLDAAAKKEGYVLTEVGWVKS